MRTTLLAIVLMLGHATSGWAQGIDLARLTHDLRLDIETTTNAGRGDYAPLWLSSNRYGLSSTGRTWNYERVALHRDTASDSTRHWRLGYGTDLALMFGGEQTFCLQELYVEAAYKRLYLTVGSKQQPLPMKNARLSSGGFIYGINARPIPQIRIGADWFSIPYTRGWWQWRGHLSYGWKTDASWQRHHLQDYGLLGMDTEWARRTEGTVYHEKALYWKFGRLESFPLQLEMGLQWVTEFGGKVYSFKSRSHMDVTQTQAGVHMDSGLKAYWHALVPGGVGDGDGDRPNADGNHLGSWNFALTFQKWGWTARAYAERMFEDYSQLGTRYGISDHLFGIELALPSNPYITGLLLEHINTREQSGAVFHDVTATIPDQMDGQDNYYNHGYYTGYQNYGMGMGHPLITSPLYNTSLVKPGSIHFQNNRIRAWHIGLSGSPLDGLDWRLLMTFSRNWGTYPWPLADPADQTYMMLEASYGPRSWRGWSGRVSVGLDRGDLIGNNTGCQLTVTKRFHF